MNNDKPHPDDSFIGDLAEAFKGREISDIQIRTGGLIYLHTNKGLEIANHLGVTDAKRAEFIAAALYSKQSVEVWSDESTGGRQQMWDTLKQKRVVDFGCREGTLGSPVRMRVQVHFSEGGLGITCRMLRSQISQMETLGITPQITENLHELLQRRFGLGLVTGPTGSGKSTTLAAMVDYVRRNFSKHIVTIEDPIEYSYDPDMEDLNRPGERIQSPSIVTQQEVGRHTLSYQSGLKEALRKTPHIILIGEIRDRDTMETCIEAAQTGHFVLSTLHTRGAVKTVDRILEFFPKDQQSSILSRLSETLTFILSQTLLTGFHGRVLVTEYLQNTSEAVAAGIRAYDGSATSLADALRYKGNLRWNSCLTDIYRQGQISEDVFRANALA